MRGNSLIPVQPQKSRCSVRVPGLLFTTSDKTQPLSSENHVTKSNLEMVVHASASSSSDYCNFLFTCPNKSAVPRLHLIQTGTNRRSHLTAALFSFHGLPSTFRTSGFRLSSHIQEEFEGEIESSLHSSSKTRQLIN